MRWFHRALALGAGLLFVSLFASAVHDVSQAWDGFYYHLPFAARLGGVVPKSELVFHAANEARFHGYPILAELLQGVLWRLTGRPECANLVAFGSLPLFAWFLRRSFQVPVATTFLALLAIPLVQEHATTSYVDLPANTCAAILVLSAVRVHAEGRATTRDVVIALAAALGAANMKFQLYPVIGVALVVLAARVWLDFKAEPAPRRLAGFALALPVVFFSALANLALHHNPVYPVRLALGPLTLPGTENAYGYAPAYLKAVPGPLRFFASLLELGLRPMTSTRRWTVDQWMDGEGNRMGGFFHAYVVAMVALLIVFVARSRSRSRHARAAAIGMSALTGVIALSPQSLELRYYMVWMIALVGFVLSLAYRPEAPKLAQPVACGVVLAALAVVLRVTQLGYVYPSGSTFQELVSEHTDPKVIESIRDGERVCVRQEPWSFTWAARFHGRHYVVQEAESAEDCLGLREVH